MQSRNKREGKYKGKFNGRHGRGHSSSYKSKLLKSIERFHNVIASFNFEITTKESNNVVSEIA